MDILIKKELDARGLSCPMPLLKTKQALQELASGEVLKVMTSDASSRRDFRSFARLSSHELVHEETDNETYSFWLKKQ